MTGPPLTDAGARAAAAAWHDGQASALYALASSGAVDLARVDREVMSTLDTLTDDRADDAADLDALLAYVHRVGDRGPVDGWHRLDTTPCRQCGTLHADHPAGDGLTSCPGDFGPAHGGVGPDGADGPAVRWPPIVFPEDRDR